MRRQDTPPLAQAAAGKEDFSSSLQVTELQGVPLKSPPPPLNIQVQDPIKTGQQIFNVPEHLGGGGRRERFGPEKGGL